MKFYDSKEVFVQKDKDGNVRHIEHLRKPFEDKDGVSKPTHLSIAQAYIKEVAKIYNLPNKALDNLNSDFKDSFDQKSGTDLRLRKVKSYQGLTSIEYQQTYKGLEVWRSGFSVTILENPRRVSSSISSFKYDVRLGENSTIDDGLVDLDLKNLTIANALKTDSLAEIKKTYETNNKYPKPKINGTRYLVYQFERDQRFDPELNIKHSDPMHTDPPVLPLPALSKKYKSGEYYIVQEILFTLALPKHGELNWRAFVDPKTKEVLYLRAFVSGISGFVFEDDPMTLSGTVLPSASQASLNALRSSVTLEGLTPPVIVTDPQELKGEYITLEELVNPVISPPTSTGNFNFNADSDDFSAVSAYYHCDWVFRTIKDFLGNADFNTYFSGSTFPVPTDHRGENGGVNAHANGNTTGDGIGRLRFGLAQSGTSVGIASDRRVVLHEFGHVLLHDHVSSPNFGFAHSAGDSLACILSDPDSALRNDVNLQWETFPFIPIIAGLRRHDRDVTAGWAWGGSNDVGGYNSEQILSTTLFRAYRSFGGGHPNLPIREFAAKYMAFLIVKAIGTLTPATNPSTSEPYATALMNTDLGITDFEGVPGGWAHKVIRWSFEKQGAYQPAGAPNPTINVGSPPDVDVYIDDGRNGEYEFQRNFWNTTDMWNRLAADGGTAHETPVLSQTNYFYVKVKNRGTQIANNVVVKAYHNIPGVGLVWPDSWQAMTTASINAGSIASGAEITVGPFQWTPAIAGHECLLAVVEADGDSSNTNNINAGQSIAHWRLVPFDNNIGQRNVAPVAGGSLTDLLAALKNRFFFVNNPLKKYGKVEFKVELPEFLLRRGWQIKFKSQGGDSFSLAPNEQRKVVFDLIIGKPFEDGEIKEVLNIDIYTQINGIDIGGMSYQIDPKLKYEEPGKSPEPSGPNNIDNPSDKDCNKKASDLLDCLGLDASGLKIKKACIKKISLDIQMDDNCNC